MNIRKIVGIGVSVLVLIVAGYAMGNEPLDQRMDAAREALNRAEFEKAARLLNEVYLEERDTEAAGNALYWEAFARYRMQRDGERQKAVKLLQLQQQNFAEVETAHEGQVLLTRLYAELAERGQIEAIQKIEQMSDEDAQREEARIQALHALMNMNPDRAVPILEKIVRDDSKGATELRRNALFILCQAGDGHSEDLLIDLAHSTTDPEMLSEIVMCLSMQGSDRALATIVELFDKSEVSGIADEALFAIGRHGGDKAFEILAKIARDPARKSEIRAQALMGLAQTGRDENVAKVASDLLRTADDKEMIEAALFALSNLDSAVPDQIFLDLINNPKANDDMRAQALFFAAQRSDLSLDFLLGVYRKADSRDLKLQVCHVISQMDDDEVALDALIKIAHTESDPEIRQNMLHWIGQYDNDKAAEYLLEVINQE